MMNLVFVFLGGGLGSLLRYGISKISMHYFESNFPLGTFISNTLSCVFLSLAVLYLSQKADHNSLKLFLITGFCGGFSTFSTFSYETFTLLKQGDYFIATLNIVLSIVVGISLLFFLLKNQAL